ncbi:MAG: general secretion pathway protein GspN [Alphaproteobacteria bacterium]|nr:general secretion pathway protein GspN [Alphaproteobacteria bacterium]
MRRSFLDVRVAALALLALATVAARAANTPDALDQPPSTMLPAPVQIAPAAPSVQPRAAEPSGNPLWAIPLSVLSATRERPLFKPSRRAPAPAVTGVVRAPPPPPPPPREPEKPLLTLVGAIVGDNEGIAVFLDQTNNTVIRLRTGQDHLGWVLRSVKGREATLEKNTQSTTLELPAPGTGRPAGIPGLPNLPGVPRGAGVPAAAPSPAFGKPKQEDNL